MLLAVLLGVSMLQGGLFDAQIVVELLLQVNTDGSSNCSMFCSPAAEITMRCSASTVVQALVVLYHL